MWRSAPLANYGPSSSQTFTAAWRSILTSGGGAITGVHVYPDGTVLAHGDTFGPWRYVRTGTVTLDGTIYAAPAWQLLATIDSLPAGDVNQTTAYSGRTTAWAIAAAPINTAILYMAYCNKLYYSTTRGATWLATGVTENYGPNGNFVPSSGLAVDPINPDVVYFVTIASGVKTTTAGSTGGSWSLISTAMLPASSNSRSGCVVFDSGQGTTGGKTNRILIGINGVGLYESTDAGGTWTLRSTGTPPTHFFQMSVDSFGTVWVVDGYEATNGRIYKLASGTWSFTAPAAALVAVFQDPLYTGGKSTNQVIAIDNANGYIWCSLDDGATWFPANPVPPGGNNFLTATGAQPGWLNNINQYDNSGNLALNVGRADIDSSGKIWAGTGVDMVTTADPITSGVINSSVTWAFDTIGTDQLVTNQIISVKDSKPLLGAWDRGVFCIENPDSFPTSQFPNKNNPTPNPLNYAPIQGCWSLDFAYGTFVVIAGINGNQNMFSKSLDGGRTWALTTQPTGMFLGCAVAASTSSNWCCVPGMSGTPAIQYTTDAGVTWHASTLNGSPASFVANYADNRKPIAADRVTAGTFYAVDTATPRKFFISTNSGADWNATGATNSDSFVQSDRIMAVPQLGSTPTNGHVMYTSQDGPLRISHDGCSSFQLDSGTLDAIVAWGFGACAPGSNYPTIYALQNAGGTLAPGFYQSTNGGTVWTSLNVPTSEKIFPNHVLDLIQWISGDWNVYGRIYVGFSGSTGCYIDTQDAVPSVNFSNVKPNQSLSGVTTISAEHSGAVPVTGGVQFQLDGSTIGSPAGPSPYSINWNASGVSAGAHTLTVIASGANGAASFSLPITTS